MSTNQKGGAETAADYAMFDEDFSKEKSLTVVPDGDHVLAIKTLTRKFTKAGDCWVMIGVSVVNSKVDSVMTREFMGKEFEIQYFLSKENRKVREMNIEFLKKLLATVAGHDMPGLFSAGFNDWTKTVCGLHAVVRQKTGEKNAEGKAFVNYYADKAYTLTDEDRKLLGASTPGNLSPVPF